MRTLLAWTALPAALVIMTAASAEDPNKTHANGSGAQPSRPAPATTTSGGGGGGFHGGSGGGGVQGGTPGGFHAPSGGGTGGGFHAPSGGGGTGGGFQGGTSGGFHAPSGGGGTGGVFQGGTSGGFHAPSGGGGTGGVFQGGTSGGFHAPSGSGASGGGTGGGFQGGTPGGFHPPSNSGALGGGPGSFNGGRGQGGPGQGGQGGPGFHPGGAQSPGFNRPPPGSGVFLHPGRPPEPSPGHRFTYHGRERQGFLAPAYRYPPGWRYHPWGRGEYLPAALLLEDYFLLDALAFGLDAPPPNAVWVRVGPDAVLVDRYSGQVLDTAPGVFDAPPPVPYDGGGYGPDNGYPPPPPPGAWPQLDPSLPPAFASGDFQLGHGPRGGCTTFYLDPNTAQQIDALWGGRDWNGLAGRVMSLGCQTDLGYYLMAISAESLGLPDAAARYYRSALELAGRPTYDPYRTCASFPDACRGVAVAQESANALRRLQR